MRKLIALLALLVVPNLAQAGMDVFSSERPAVWRSSRTEVAENLVAIATGPIHFHAVIVESSTVNLESWIAFFNSTSAPAGGYNPNITTAAFLQTKADVNTIGAFPNSFEYNLYFSSGLVVNKLGAAKVTILWDFINPARRFGTDAPRWVP